MAEINRFKRLITFFYSRHILYATLPVLCLLMLQYQNLPDNKQGKKKIELINADIDYIVRDSVGKDLHRLIGNVQLKHNTIKMSCDSAHFSPDKNQVTAFSKIHIKQGDTLDLYGDFLFYDGRIEIAIVTGNVELIDKETHLFTQAINYDVKNEIARYNDHGRITNAKNTLTSIIGVYFVSDNIFHFKDSVKIVNPDYVMTADTMDYNTISETSYFSGPTVLKGDSINLYCEKGWFDTKKDITHIWKKAMIDNKQQIVHGDSLFFDNNTHYGESFGNVVIEDTTNNLIIEGNSVYKES